MPDSPARHLALQGASNFRDLGGYPTIDGRSTRVANEIMVHSLAIEPTVVAALRAELAKGALTGPIALELMRESYRNYVRHHTHSFRSLFEHLLEDHAPLVIHCTAGKDRTGFASALILHALGVPDQIIAEDYLLTNRHYKRDATAASDLPADVLDAIGSVEASYLAAAFEAVGEEYGNLETYLRDGLKLGIAERTALKERYLQA